MHIAQGKTSDGDATGGSTGRAAVLVVLLNDDAVVRDSGKGDVLVCDVLDGASRAINGLDADAFNN